MIEAKFFNLGNDLYGFEISGHSGYVKKEKDDIVCAAVSSAALMAANTITEILHLDADVDMNEDGFLKLTADIHKDAQPVLRGLELHLKALSQEYPKNIKVTSNGGANNA